MNKFMKWFGIITGAVCLLLGMIFYSVGNLEASFWSLLIGSFVSVGATLTLEVK